MLHLGSGSIRFYLDKHLSRYNKRSSGQIYIKKNKTKLQWWKHRVPRLNNWDFEFVLHNYLNCGVESLCT